jgi:Domain of unknown function (DUF4160)
MPTIHREGGLRFVVYLEDHPPPHVHIIGDGEAKIALLNGEARLIWQRGFSQSDVNKALNVVRVQYVMMLEVWESIHGRHN